MYRRTMLFRQVTHDDLGCASYLVGDDEAGVAAVVDPRFEIDVYLDLARYMGVRIEHILETHNHADHVSGPRPPGARHRRDDPRPPARRARLRARAVRRRLGARARRRRRARAAHARPPPRAHRVRADRPRARRRAVGGAERRLAVRRRHRAARPRRRRATEGARAIFRSLHDQLLALPDSCEVWPGHLGGSMCGGPGMDMKVSSTIGYERAHNALLREPDDERFVERSLATLGPQPPNFQAIVALNRGPLLTGGVEAPPLTPRQVELKQRRGRARRRRAHRPAVRRGAHPGRGLHHGAERRLRLAAGVDRRPRRRRSCSSAATTTTRCTRRSSRPRSASAGWRASCTAG